MCNALILGIYLVGVIITYGVSLWYQVTFNRDIIDPGYKETCLLLGAIWWFVVPIFLIYIVGKALAYVIGIGSITGLNVVTGRDASEGLDLFKTDLYNQPCPSQKTKKCNH